MCCYCGRSRCNGRNNKSFRYDSPPWSVHEIFLSYSDMKWILESCVWRDPRVLEIVLGVSHLERQEHPTITRDFFNRSMSRTIWLIVKIPKLYSIFFSTCKKLTRKNFKNIKKMLYEKKKTYKWSVESYHCSFSVVRSRLVNAFTH